MPANTPEKRWVCISSSAHAEAKCVAMVEGCTIGDVVELGIRLAVEKRGQKNPALVTAAVAVREATK